MNTFSKKLKVYLKKDSFERGFTLAEIILAIVIVLFIVMLLINLPPSIGLIGRSKQEALAKDIALKKVESIRSTNYDNLANGSSAITDIRLSSLPNGTGEVTIEDCPAQICTNGEVAKKVYTKVSWKHNSKDQSIEISTIVSKGGLK